MVAALKRDARAGRLPVDALLADRRAETVELFTLLGAIPGLSTRSAFDVLHSCRINGSTSCGELTAAERKALAAAIPQVGSGIAAPPAPMMPGHPEGVDRELDRTLRGTRRTAPSVGLAPSEFAAARAGLEPDPQLLRMIDRLVDAVRLYAIRDDGGVRARIVAEQWIRFRNYRTKVASGELPRPSQKGPVMPE